MEPVTPMDNARRAFESQVRESYARVAYAHKTHLKIADRLSAEQSFFKISQIVLSAIITSGIVSFIVYEKKAIGILTALASLTQLILSSYLKDVNPGAIATLHSDAATELWSVREDFLAIIAETQDPTCPLADLKARRVTVQERLKNAYKGHPKRMRRDMPPLRRHYRGTKS